MVIVECQGEMAHDSRGRAQADDDRALALESMGTVSYTHLDVYKRQVDDDAAVVPARRNDALLSETA